MTRKILMLTPESIEKISKSFSGVDEIAEFILDMDVLVSELSFCIETRKRTEGMRNTAEIVGQVCSFALFCRDHVELIHDLINSLELKEVSEEEINNMKNDL